MDMSRERVLGSHAFRSHSLRRLLVTHRFSNRYWRWYGYAWHGWGIALVR